MESARIEKLLEAYFDGNTTLEQEAQLRTYFSSDDVAPKLQSYQPIFAAFQKAKEEVSHRELSLPSKSSNYRRWWYSIAASAVIAIGVAGFVFSEPQLSTEEKEALIAFNESKKAIMLLSENFNEGARDLALIDEFTQTKNKILK